MNGYFTDNQTKQKAYDSYYNAMAKSDYIQGSKLKALIQQEALDDASTNSLANLFQQVMAKSRDYDYDKITKKLTKAAPEIIKGTNLKKNAKINLPFKTKKTAKLKLKFVPHVTDTDIPMTPPRRASSEKNFEQKMSDEDMGSPPQTPQSSFHPPVTMNIKKKTSSEADNILDFVDQNVVNEKIEANDDGEALKEEIFNIGRKAVAEANTNKKKKKKTSMKASITKDVKKVIVQKRFKYLDKNEKNAVVKEMVEQAIDFANSELGKRKRQMTPPNQTPSDKRMQKKAMRDIEPLNLNRFDALYEDDEDDKSRGDSIDAESEEELKERAYNKKRREEAELVINKASRPIALHTKLKEEFGKEISRILAKREGKSSPRKGNTYTYFNKEFPKPHKDQDLKTYKEEIDGLLKGIYLY